MVTGSSVGSAVSHCCFGVLCGSDAGFSSGCRGADAAAAAAGGKSLCDAF